jgi:hypothetical protein
VPHLSGQLTPWGPLINVIVSPSAPRVAALTAAGQPVPPGIVAKLVVDTGASLTSVDSSILQQLGLTPRGQTLIHTPSTQGNPHAANQYDVAVAIYGTPPTVVYTNSALAVIDGDFKAQGIDGLLGRDVLAVGRLTYSGDLGWYGISF